MANKSHNLDEQITQAIDAALETPASGFRFWCPLAVEVAEGTRLIIHTNVGRFVVADIDEKGCAAVRAVADRLVDE